MSSFIQCDWYGNVTIIQVKELMTPIEPESFKVFASEYDKKLKDKKTWKKKHFYD